MVCSRSRSVKELIVTGRVHTPDYRNVIEHRVALFTLLALDTLRMGLELGWHHDLTI